MSRFFYRGGSDSESSSSDEEEDVLDRSEEEESDEEESSEESGSDSGSDEDSSEEESSEEESDEDSDEDKPTIVKSAKDKRLEGLENTIRLIDNAEKINDWVVISNGEFSPWCDILVSCCWGFVGGRGVWL